MNTKTQLEKFKNEIKEQNPKSDINRIEAIKNNNETIGFRVVLNKLDMMGFKLLGTDFKIISVGLSPKNLIHIIVVESLK